MGEAAASAVAAMMPKRMKVRASMALQSRANRGSACFPSAPSATGAATGATNLFRLQTGLAIGQDEQGFYK
jgi:hypothetical protein